MPFPPDSDTTGPDRAQHDGAAHPARPGEDRSPRWADRARAGSAATAVAALAALGGAAAAHAAPAQIPQVAPAPGGPGREAAGAGEHTVARGDSLWAIAGQHGVGVAELMRWNDLSGAALLRAGQTLRLGAAGAPPAAAPEAAPGPGAARSGHTVRPGDSLWGIAQATGVSVQQLLEANDLTVGSLLRPGQRLALGGPAPAGPVPEAGARTVPAEAGRPVPDTFPARSGEDEVVGPAGRHHDPPANRPAPSREQMRGIVHDTAVRMGVDPALALAHAQQESGFDHRSVSPADAVGTMQVVPGAGEWASGLVGRELDLLDPRDNVTAGIAIIRQLHRRAPSADLAIAAYYQGLHGVRRYGLYDDTKRYVEGVKALRESFAR